MDTLEDVGELLVGVKGGGFVDESVDLGVREDEVVLVAVAEG